MTPSGLVLCVVLMLAIISKGSTNPCIHCITQGEESTCDSISESLTCTADLAERYISIFARINENIDLDMIDKTQFKCFKFKMAGQEDYHMKGCTFKNLQICDNMLDGMTCKTCESADCNSMYNTEYYDEGSGNVVTPVASIGVQLICVVFVGVRYFRGMH